LWELVDAVLAHHRADGGDPGIVLDLEEQAIPAIGCDQTVDAGIESPAWTRFYEPLLAPKHELTVASHIHHSWCSTLDRNWVEL